MLFEIVWEMTPKLRLDANQGMDAKEAVQAIRSMEDTGLSIELVEQPVPAWDHRRTKICYRSYIYSNYGG